MPLVKPKSETKCLTAEWFKTVRDVARCFLNTQTKQVGHKPRRKCNPKNKGKKNPISLGKEKWKFFNL